MTARKLPEDAFAFYVALGATRSYETVAKHYGSHKRTVVRTADREEWMQRLAAIERKAREVTDAKLADQLAEMNDRHRKLLLAVASRAAGATPTINRAARSARVAGTESAREARARRGSLLPNGSRGRPT